MMITETEHETLKSTLTEILANEGFRPKLNEHDDIQFKLESAECFLEFDSEDPAYVRMILPWFWTFEDASQDLPIAYEACNHACRLCKGVKIFVMEESGVWATVESVCTGIDSLSSELLERYISMLRSGCRAFECRFAEIKQEMSTATAAVKH